ncbi:hypothetical protein APSETT444_010799 [Aspergillus pseudonomiae]
MSSSKHHPSDCEKWPQNTQEDASPADTNSLAGSTSTEDTEELQQIVTQASRQSMSLARKTTTIGTNATSDPRYKGMAIAFLSWNTLVV